jgi:hypothetical protein
VPTRRPRSARRSRCRSDGRFVDSGRAGAGAGGPHRPRGCPRGELILPAAGSGAALQPAEGDERSELRFVFPVEIEVRGGYEEVDVEAVVDAALKRLARGLRST